MDYLKNHCWCSSSHWDGKSYDCQIIVGLSSYEEYDKEDWSRLTMEKAAFSQEDYDNWKTVFEGQDVTEEKLRRFATKSIRVFRPEILNWLNDNVPDDASGKKMWCVGSDTYNLAGSACSLNVFFQRRRDAMLFIKTCSKWKRPVNYTQYFTDVRKTLNLTTLKYEER
ncbi:hypothetical protein PODOV061v2_0029 [Vibrio phage 172P1]|nr:hypothetical protein PODOV061v2_0029 [Vibrio phage 172P1]